MGEIRDAWKDFVWTVKRRIFAELRRVTYERGERIVRRIQAWRKPNEWVPIATHNAVVADANRARQEAAELSRALADSAARPNIAAMVNDADLDKLRHHATRVGFEAGYEKGLREAGAIKAWKEAKQLRDLVKQFQNAAGKAAWRVGDDHFADLENAAQDIIEYAWSVIGSDGSIS